MSPSDNELMYLVRDGDVQKLGILFERHHGRLFNFLVRFTGRTEVAQDLVQEVFFRILKYRHTFRGDAAFTTWLYQTGRNAAIDHSRKWRDNPSERDRDPEHADDGLSPADMLEQIERNDLLSLALNRISVEHREVIVLSRFVGMKYEQISAVLGRPVGTIKAQMHHGLKELRGIYLGLSEEASL